MLTEQNVGNRRHITYVKALTNQSMRHRALPNIFESFISEFHVNFFVKINIKKKLIKSKTRQARGLKSTVNQIPSVENNDC